MNRKALAAAVAVLLALSAAYVLLKPPPEPEPTKPRIGSLLILSGDYAPYGEMVANGQALAEVWLAADGLEIERLQPLDFEADKGKANELLLRSVRQDGVTFFAGLMGTGFVEHTAPEMTAQNIVVVDGTATGDKLSGISPGFFRTIPADGAAAREALGWIQAEGQSGNVHLLFANTSWGTGLKDSYLIAAEELGVSIPEESIEELPEGATIEQVQAAAQRMTDAAPSAVVLAVYGTEAAGLMRAWTEGDGTAPPVYGTDNLVGEFADKAGVFANGARFVIAKGGTLDPEVRALYVEAHGEPEGGEVPAYVITGFNATVAAARAYEATDGDAVAAREWLKTAEIQGAEGPFRFTAAGDFGGASYERMRFTIEDDKPVSVAHP